MTDQVNTHEFLSIDDVAQRLGGTLLRHVPTGLWVTADHFGGSRGSYTFIARDKNNVRVEGPITDLDYSSPKLGIFKDRDNYISLATRRPDRQYRGGVPIQSIELICLSRENTRGMGAGDLTSSFVDMLSGKYQSPEAVVSKFFETGAPSEEPIKRLAWLKTNSFGVFMLKYMTKTIFAWTHKGTLLEQANVTTEISLQQKLLSEEARRIETILKERR